MTMLMQWVMMGTIILGPWIAFYRSEDQSNWSDQTRLLILAYPLLLLIAFGVYSVAVIAWRVYSFNDCQEASDELKGQIQEAKAGLAKKGFKFVKS